MSTPGVKLGSSWGKAGVKLGSSWGQPGVKVGSTWGQAGVNLGSNWGQTGVKLVSSWGQPAAPHLVDEELHHDEKRADGQQHGAGSGQSFPDCLLIANYNRPLAPI